MNEPVSALPEQARLIQEKITKLLERPGRTILQDCPPAGSRLNAEPHLWVHVRPLKDQLFVQFATRHSSPPLRHEAVNDIRHLLARTGTTISEMDEGADQQGRASLEFLIRDVKGLSAALDRLIQNQSRSTPHLRSVAPGVAVGEGASR